MKSKGKHNVIDLFAGMGGLSLPFHRDGRFDVVLANELLKPMADAIMQSVAKFLEND